MSRNESRGVCLSLALTFSAMFLWSSVVKSEGTLHGIRCRRSQPQVLPLQKQIVFAPWKFSPIVKRVSNDAVFYDSLIEEDLPATLQVLAVGNGVDSNSPAYPFFLGPESPDAFALIRGNDVTVFPRAFIFDPVVRTFPLMDRDIIASARFDKILVDSEDTPTIITRSLDRLLSAHGEKDAEVSLSIIGPLITREREGKFLLKTEPDIGSDQVTWFELEEGSTFVGDKKFQLDDLLIPTISQTQAIEDDLAYCVVIHRRVDNFWVHRLVPLNKSGYFSANGAFVRKVSPKSDDVSLSQRWKDMFDRNVVLQDGDILELTILNLVEPFRHSLVTSP